MKAAWKYENGENRIDLGDGRKARVVSVVRFIYIVEGELHHDIDTGECKTEDLAMREAEETLSRMEGYQ